MQKWDVIYITLSEVKRNNQLCKQKANTEEMLMIMYPSCSMKVGNRWG